MTFRDHVISTLRASGVRRVYGLPGDSLNGFTDAIRRFGGDRWEHVRHEENAAFAAAADAALTGELAVCAGSCSQQPARPGPRGFIPTDPSFRVDGLDGVYAAGDATWYPIKQGGLASQQADVVATAIAGEAGEPVRSTPFHPVLHGILVGGEKPLHLRGGDGLDSVAGFEPLWWPPGKVAGRYITPYLAARHGDTPRPPLTEIEHPAPDKEGVDQAGVLEMALAAADASARAADYEGALRWLDAAEQLNVVLSVDHASRRRAWARALAGQRLEG